MDASKMLVAYIIINNTVLEIQCFYYEERKNLSKCLET